MQYRSAPHKEKNIIEFSALCDQILHFYFSIFMQPAASNEFLKFAECFSRWIDNFDWNCHAFHAKQIYRTSPNIETGEIFPDAFAANQLQIFSCVMFLCNWEKCSRFHLLTTWTRWNWQRASSSKCAWRIYHFQRWLAFEMNIWGVFVSDETFIFENLFIFTDSSNGTLKLLFPSWFLQSLVSSTTFCLSSDVSLLSSSFVSLLQLCNLSLAFQYFVSPPIFR